MTAKTMKNPICNPSELSKTLILAQNVSFSLPCISSLITPPPSFVPLSLFSLSPFFCSVTCVHTHTHTHTHTPLHLNPHPTHHYSFVSFVSIQHFLSLSLSLSLARSLSDTCLFSSVKRVGRIVQINRRSTLVHAPVKS